MAVKKESSLGTVTPSESDSVRIITSGLLSKIATITGLRTLLNSISQTITGNLTVSGSVTADRYNGDGSALTGIASGTGGVINTGSTTIGADSNDDDSGVIALQIKGVTKAGVNNGGVFEADSADIDGLSDDLVMSGKELLQSKTILDQQITPYYNFNGSSGKIQVTDDTSFAELFANGGTYICKFNAFSAGEGDLGRFWQKAGFGVSFISGLLRIIADFSGTNGDWRSTTAIEFNKDSIAVITYDASSEANSPSLYVDGSEVALTRQTAPIGTVSTDAGDLYISNFSAADARTFDGNIYSTIFLNREFTAAEATSWSSNPQKALDWKDDGGSNSIEISDFSAGTDGYTAGAGAVAGNIDAIGGEDDWLRFTCNTASGAHYTIISGAVGWDRTTLSVGKSYEVSFTYYIPSGQSNIDGIRVANQNTSQVYGSLLSVTDSSTDVTITVIPTVSATGLVFLAADGGVNSFTDAGGDDVFYIKNVVLRQLGATLVLTGENATDSIWYDSSGNGNDGAVTTATRHNKRQTELDSAVVSVGTFIASHKVKILIAGVEYYVQLDAI